MKLNVKLGVPTADLLKSPTACFRLSKAAARVSDALSFSEFYLYNTKGGVVLPRDLDHVSAALHTSSKSADDLAILVEDPELRKEITAYSQKASKFNKLVRKTLPKKGKPAVDKAVKAPTLAIMKEHTKELRNNVREIEKKVEDLCTVNPPAAPASPSVSGSRGRFAMAGGGSSLKKKPIYPRYFVASMGRSRR